MRKIAIIFGSMLLLVIFVLATDSIATYLGEPDYPKCYSLKYLHISGTEQWMQMQLTTREARQLHEDIKDGVPVLSVNAIGSSLRTKHIRVIGATGIISLTPCL